ncbi:bola-like protein [Lentinus tigrinus ALCF2SS1-7]|uniref:Bola-like protein n=1 Tax=Lentinus tigrinus ALCF2SS1-6 TaxID=1328759 RepID=A0A5C2SKM2_9APHY|nr:bola-like protein [Lentinus tigrinus ALCF2SS1-6]RPD74501.1 bola-like protein [Lentinus tigrinus ALCF2SS1-7]
MFSLALARRIARPALVGRPATAFARWYAAQANFATEGEKVIHDKLTEKFRPTELHVEDVSGGCGTFYNIIIASDEFKGLSLVKQQRLVNQTLKEEIQGIHGLQLKTMTPK